MAAQVPSLTRLVGETERTLQEVLRRQLERSGVSFPEWVVFTLVAPVRMLPRTALIDSLARARIVAAGKEDDLISSMIAAGHIEEGVDLAITEAGASVFQPLRQSISSLIDELMRDIPPENVETTRLVLALVQRRASELLSGKLHLAAPDD